MLPLAAAGGRRGAAAPAKPATLRPVMRSRRPPRSRIVLLVLAVAAAALLGAVDACWLETRVLLLEDAVRIPLIVPRLRLVHLSDLHVAGDSPLLHQLLRRVAAARPELIAVSGDLISDVQDPRPQARHTAAAAAFISQLRRLAPRAPIYAVQGHSEYQGEGVVALRRAGITRASHEGGRARPRGTLPPLGLNQPAGIPRLPPARTAPFPARR